MKHFIRILWLALVFAFLTACGGSDSGTSLTHRELYDRIQQGMTQKQVRELIDEPATEPLYSKGIFIGEVYSRGKPNTPEWTSIVVSYDYLSNPSTGVNGKAYFTTTEVIVKDYTQ